jgi:hypothetical protein
MQMYADYLNCANNLCEIYYLDCFFHFLAILIECHGAFFEVKWNNFFSIFATSQEILLILSFDSYKRFSVTIV